MSKTAETPRPVIGKDVIENLTTGMYDDPRCVFREYVQNAADAIDAAVRQGFLEKEKGEIFILIDPERRAISVEDNGTGVAVEQIFPILQNIAMSSKTRGKDKGFRGIGRLGGLAYCDSLVFETSAPEEPIKSTLTWDARRLKKTLDDRSQKEEAAEVVRAVTTWKYENEDVERHYFRVTMLGVSDETLLDAENIRNYLRGVAPLPFDMPFSFRKRIFEEAQNAGVSFDEYNIFLNSEQLYKGYTNQVFSGAEGGTPKQGEILDVLFFSGKDKNGQPLYWGWHSISDVQSEQLKSHTKMRGLRLRRHNIQIGDDDRLKHLFQDPRFNYYIVGEVHALHPDLIPNARRDFFNESPARLALEEDLKKTVCRAIHQLSHQTAKAKSEQRKIEEYEKLTIEVEQRSQKGFNSEDEARDYQNRLNQTKTRAVEAEKNLQKIHQRLSEPAQFASPLNTVLSSVLKPDLPKVQEVREPEVAAKPKLRVEELTGLNEVEQRLLSRVFGIISRVLTREMADNLIEKIEEEIGQQA